MLPSPFATTAAAYEATPPDGNGGGGGGADADASLLLFAAGSQSSGASPASRITSMNGALSAA
jgi:hypothetical protein